MYKFISQQQQKCAEKLGLKYISERGESQTDKLMIAPAFPWMALALLGNKWVSESESNFHTETPRWGTGDLREGGHQANIYFIKKIGVQSNQEPVSI